MPFAKLGQIHINFSKRMIFRSGKKEKVSPTETRSMKEHAVIASQHNEIMPLNVLINDVLHSGAMFEESHSNNARNILAYMMSYFGTYM